MPSRAPSIKEIYSALLSELGQQGWWPVCAKHEVRANYHPRNYSLPKTEKEKFEVCVGAILAQNTSWKNASSALETLRAAKALNRNSILSLSREGLAKIIHSSGYHFQKARKLKEFAQFRGKITRQSLLGLWGIGPETADSILLYAYHKPFFVADAYAKRIFFRLGICRENARYEEVQQLAHKSFPASHREYNEFHALLVALGKDYCRPKPLCAKCALKERCGFAKSPEKRKTKSFK